MSELKAGDIVRIRTFALQPSHWDYAGDMAKLSGKIVTIKSSIRTITLNEYPNWMWRPSDFEELVQKIDFDIEGLFKI
jgi:hypothetical protein